MKYKTQIPKRIQMKTMWHYIQTDRGRTRTTRNPGRNTRAIVADVAFKATKP